MSFVVSKETVVLLPDANLPDGTEVRVEPLPAKPLSERLSDVIGMERRDWHACPYFPYFPNFLCLSFGVHSTW